MKTDSFKFQTSDGETIFVNQWLPDEISKMKAVVQISHGMAEHSDRYNVLQKSFAKIISAFMPTIIEVMAKQPEALKL